LGTQPITGIESGFEMMACSRLLTSQGRNCQHLTHHIVDTDVTITDIWCTQSFGRTLWLADTIIEKRR